MAEDHLPRIECAIAFLKAEEGGRSVPPILLGRSYRPHLVVGDPGRREAIVDEYGRGAEDYLGVAFEKGPANVTLGEEIVATLVLMFYPHPTYDKLTPGAAFTVREGLKVVGHGTVLRWLK
jgi:hypothetical protein